MDPECRNWRHDTGGNVIETSRKRASLKGAGPAAQGRRWEVLGIYGPLGQASV